MQKFNPPKLNYSDIIERIKASRSFCFAQDKLNSFRKWAQYDLTPYLHKQSEIVIDQLTFESGSKEWAVIKSSNRWNRYIVWTLVSVAGFGITWAMFARIDEAVQATGKLEPLGTTIDIKAPLGGVIKNINIEEGQLIKKDQVLIVLDTTAAKARLEALLKVKEKTTVDLMLSKSQLGQTINESDLNNNQKLRLKALKEELESRISASKSEVIQSEEQLRASQEQLLAKQSALNIRERIFSNIAPLAEQGGISMVQYLKEKQDIELLKGEILSLQASSRRLMAAVNQSKQKLSNTRSLTKIDFSTKVEESEKQLAQLNNQISETLVTLKYQELKSPKDGIVFDLQASSPGYVVNSQRPILKIVPIDNLVARIFLSNKDIGFIKPGQPVKIRVDAFPYNEFGELSGSILSIGSDVLEPDENFNYYRFPATVSLDSNTLAYKDSQLPLIAGMSINANIILRQRPVISIFTKRLLPFWDSLEKL